MMKLENFKKQANVISKEAMAYTFGGYTLILTGCAYTGTGTFDCSSVDGMD